MMLCPLRIDVAALSIGSPEIIDRDFLKKHVRVDFDDDNDLLDTYLLAAALWCENATNRTIFRRAVTWVLRDFNQCFPYELLLPRGKTASVDSVVCSVNGVLETLTGPSASPAGGDYQEDLTGDAGGVLMPRRGGAWPSVDADVPAPVTVNFTAGWAAGAVPESLIHAIMFGVADLYDLRGTADMDVNLLNGSGARLAARNALVSSYTLTRIY